MVNLVRYFVGNMLLEYLYLFSYNSLVSSRIPSPSIKVHHALRYDSILGI